MGEEIAPYRDAGLLARWATLVAVRDEVNLALEQKRQEQVIKANLSAQVRLEAGVDEGRLLARYRDFLPTLFGVSHVELVERAADTPRQVTVSRADGVRCDRCWRMVPDVSRESGTEGLCPRCVDALAPAAHA
jgi:isoleucyl-tRNA synthetase